MDFNPDPIKRYKQTKNIDEKTDMIRLFILKEKELIQLAQESFTGLATKPPVKGSFETKLLQLYINHQQEPQLPDTKYYHLRYFWEPFPGYRVPGYMTKTTEIIANYTDIVAYNLYHDWFFSSSPSTWKVFDGLDFVNTIGNNETTYNLHGFYDNPKNNTRKAWKALQDKLRQLSDNPKYQLLVRSIIKYYEVGRKLPGITNYEEAEEKWFAKFHKDHYLPLHLWGFQKKWPLEVERRFDEKNNWLEGECLRSFDPHLKRAEFLKHQLEHKINLNERIGLLELRRYGYHKFRRLYPNYNYHLFKDNIRQLVAMQFKDRLYSQVNEDIKLITTESATTRDLALVSAFAFHSGLFKSLNKSHNFFALHFQVRATEDKSPVQKTPDAFRKAIEGLKKSNVSNWRGTWDKTVQSIIQEE